MPGERLEARSIGHVFGARVALEEVSFDVRSGEIFGLLGPNGAGKTTLLSILSGLRSPTSGEVRIGGEVLRPRGRALKRKIGLAPQEIALYPELTAAENLRFFGELYRLDDLDRRVREVLELTGLTERAGERVATFSGGMQRRLNFGAALVHGPAIVFLDEPTAGVDPQSRNHLFEGVRRLNAAGVTVLYTSHYMEEVEALCHRIGIIDQGRLIACDTLANLLSRLPAAVRFTVAEAPASWDGLSESSAAIAASPATAAASAFGQPVRDEAGWRLECRDPSATLLRLTSWCHSHGVTLTSITTDTPNLEKVFLHLTGKRLRD